jgi:GT2 family glycosyltransferase/2-polyprenyl-3-methyl-5-hydroxy-6-metoxy-1,4-benzoquinol methylase
MKYNVGLNLNSNNDSTTLILKHIKSDSTVLEFGPANGRMTKYMKEILNCKVYIVEIDKKAGKDAAKHAVDYLFDDIEQYKWLDRFRGISFDYIIFADVLEHLRHPEKVLSSSKLLLEQDGSILISVPNIGHNAVLIDLANNKFEYRETGLLDNTHIHFFTYGSLEKMIQNAELYPSKKMATYSEPQATEFANSYTMVNGVAPAFWKTREYGNVYQFVYEVKQLRDAPNQQKNFLHAIPRIYNAQLFYDDGYGFSEEKAITQYIDVRSDRLSISFVMDEPLYVEKIRFDPLNAPCIIKINGVMGVGYGRNVKLEIEGSNADIYSDNTYYFSSNDSHMYITTHKIIYEKIVFDIVYKDFDSDGTLAVIQEIQEEKNKRTEREAELEGERKRSAEEVERLEAEREAELEGERRRHSDELADELGKLREECETELAKMREEHEAEIVKLNEGKDAVQNACDCYSAELAKLREEHEAEIEKLTKEKDAVQNTRDYYSTQHSLALAERDALQAKLFGAEAAFNSIINSEFWRVTKPARVIMDITKLALKRLPLIKYLYKFIACWKNFGFRNAIANVKMFFLRKRRKSHKNYQILPAKEYKRQENTRFEKKVKFSVLAPLYNTPEKLLVEMIESVENQTYKDWELCLADGSDGRHGHVERICRRLSRKDKRIIYKKLEKNLGISGNTNACVDMSTGDYIGLLDHDDLLHPSALFEAMRVVCEKDADVIYTDEDKTDMEGERRFDPHFKPDFAIDNLRAYNYICHFLVFKKELLNKAGRFDSRYDGAQDYDLTFRLIEQAERIVHIPLVLYHWRVTTDSTASNINTKNYAIKANVEAVESHLKRCGLNADVVSIPIDPTVHRVVYKLLDKPLVSIIIANKDHAADLEKCVSSIARRTNYSNYEIVIIENNSELEETFVYYEEIKKRDNVKVVVYNGEFNYSKINNFGVRHASGEYMILLNNDIEIISSCWIEEMLMLCQRDDVGAVGAKLYYYDNTIQHGGVILGIGGVAGHSHKCFPKSHPGYFLRLSIQQDLSAVTAACMMIKRNVFDEIEGFNSDFAVAFNDIDLCMRIRKAGYLIAWTPFAEAYHYESKSRGLEDTPEKYERFRKESGLFQSLWSKELSDGDPYYNVNLTLDREDFSLA